MEQRFAAFAGLLESLELVGLGFAALAVLELIWDLATRRRSGIAESGANFLIAAGNQLLDRTVHGLVFVVGLFLVELFAPFRIPIDGRTWILAILAADFSYYWMHRLEHKTRLLWAYHGVHHSSPEFNLTTAFRLAWVEGLVEWLFFVPMLLLGFDAVQTLIAIIVVVTYQSWIHTQKIGKLGWLDRVLNTPSAHRVHHGANPAYLDKNYGGILILWDRLFGTYQAEEEHVVFGLTKPLNSANPLWINLHELWAIARDCLRTERAGDIWGYLFGRPGWQPK